MEEVGQPLRFHIGGQKRSVGREIGLAATCRTSPFKDLPTDLLHRVESKSYMQREELRDRVRVAICELPPNIEK